MKILVQKFGGTSLATPDARRQAAARVAKARAGGYGVVAVFSAAGRFPDPYATDTLLKLIGESAGPDKKDLLAICGELISTAMMAHILDEENIPCEILALERIGIITDDRHGDAQILEIDAAPVRAVLESGKVAVVPGFQGMTRGRKVTTLGRGGSDITAAALGAALKADLIEIYKDVDGVFSADPRIVPDASILSEITFQEVGEMAFHGAKVLHPKAVSFAMEHRIPIRVRSTFSGGEGTLIAPEIVEFKGAVSGVAHIPDVAYVQVTFSGESSDGARHKLFEAFAGSGISLDLITVSRDGVDFIIQESQTEPARKLLEKHGWFHSVSKGFAKVSVVGAGMRGKPGVMFRVVDALHKAGIPLYHSTDSHITIACLVKRADMESAVRVLHAAFVTAEQDEEKPPAR